MAHITGVFRIGRDVELRYTASGDCVCNLALAFNYGQKGEDGNRPSQWVEASLWGKRAESLAPHLLKGTQVYCVLGEPHIETYDGKNGPGHKLVARVADIEFAGSRPAEAAPRQQPAQRPPERNGYAEAKGKPQPSTSKRASFDDMDDDIPF